MRIRKLFVTPLILCAGLLGFSDADAQNLQSVSNHNNIHNDLLAKQQTVKDQISLETTRQYMEQLVEEEEEEPESDIYTEGWGSDLVNPYKNSEVPNSKVINVKDFAMPHMGYVTSPYGYRKRFRRMHKGIDLKCQIGDTIYAAFDGKVRLTKYERKGYGYYVILRHDNGLETVYGHLSRFLVKPDEYVKAGQPIALGGNTGRSTGSHLHFETRFMGYAINPAAIVDFNNKTTHTDYYTFDKRTYTEGRDYSPAADRERYFASLKDRPKTNEKFRATTEKIHSTYRIKKGDTLSKIAANNGTTINKLCKLNGITTKTKLQPGKVLKIH